MKILLVYPLSKMAPNNTAIWIPLGLPFIAASLRARGHQVRIFDRYAIQFRVGANQEKVDHAMLDCIKDFKPDIVAFNTVSPLIYDTAACVSLVRQNFDGLIIAGGHHVTALPETTLQRIPGLSMVIQGEAELSMLALADGYDREVIPGACWQEERIINNAPQQVMDLDSLPFPALDLMDMDFYTRPGTLAIRGYYLRTACLLASRGCERRCDFCSESLTYGRGVRYHSIDYVMEWMHSVITDYKVEGIYFQDNDFLIDRKRIEEFCDRMLNMPSHIRPKWAIQARVDHIDPALAKLLKQAGCCLIEFGVESDDQNSLDSFHKGATVDANMKAIKLCRDAGLAVHTYILTGVEGESLADLDRLMDWLKKANPTSFSWSRLSIHPGTRLYQKHGKEFFEKNDWTQDNITGFYDQDHFSGIDPNERAKWMDKNYYPVCKSIYRRNLLQLNPLTRVVAYGMSKIRKTR